LSSLLIEFVLQLAELLDIVEQFEEVRTALGCSEEEEAAEVGLLIQKLAQGGGLQRVNLDEVLVAVGLQSLPPAGAAGVEREG